MMARMRTKGCSTVLRETRGHADVEWEIRNFVGLPYRNGEYLRSPHFLLGDAAWCIDIYPKGEWTGCRDGWISLFLSRVNCSGTHTVSFRFGIKAGSLNESNRFIEISFNEEMDSFGLPEFIKMSTISNSLKGGESSNGAVTILCTAHLFDGRGTEATTQTSQQESKLIQCQHKEAATQTSELEGQNIEATPATSRTEGLQALSKRFEDLFLGGNWSDIKIQIGEREFDVHKFVLRARSPVFAAMFDHEMAEIRSGVVDIPDMDPDSFKDFLLFMYSGQFCHVTSSNAVCLYKTADKYAVEGLKEECNRRMVSDLSVESVLDVITLAITYGEYEILKIASEFFLENAEEIVSTANWGSFHEKNIPMANELLIKMAKSLKDQRKELMKLRK